MRTVTWSASRACSGDQVKLLAPVFGSGMNRGKYWACGESRFAGITLPGNGCPVGGS